MKAILFLFLVALAGCAPQTKPDRIVWEYRIDLIASTRQALKEGDSVVTFVDLDRVKEWNTLGESGWELVTVVKTEAAYDFAGHKSTQPGAVAIFKRKR